MCVKEKFLAHDLSQLYTIAQQYHISLSKPWFPTMHHDDIEKYNSPSPEEGQNLLRNKNRTKITKEPCYKIR